MRPIAAISFALALVGPVASARADSPLTGTSLAAGYGDVPAVQRAGRQGMGPAVARTLSDPSVPTHVRAAVAASFGWSLGGEDNARAYLNELARARGTSPSSIRLADLGAPEAMALGLLRALDDYLELRPMGGAGQLERSSPLVLLRQAKAQAPGDPVVALVHGLVRAQYDLHKDRWCRAWHDVFDVIRANGGSLPVRPEALQSVTT